MNLFRPVGLEELRLIYEGQMRAFPPRLPDQPIFYPVLNEPYARQIAKDWNTKTGTRSGFVTHFAVDDDYGSRFERRVVGGREHEELWVPAEDLHEFNANLTTPIVVTGAFFGEGYGGSVPENFSLKGKTAVEQLVALADIDAYSKFDFVHEVSDNHVVVFLNFFFWEQHDFTALGFDLQRRDQVLEAIRSAWASSACGAVSLGAAA